MTNMAFSVADNSSALDAPPAVMIRSSLAQAQRLALSGATEAARRQCAETIARWQLWISRDPALLQLAVTSLLHANGFEMVRRLLAASRGSSVRLNLINSGLPPPGSGISATVERDGSTTYTIFNSVFDSPSRMRLIEALSRRLTTGLTIPAASPAVADLQSIRQDAMLSLYLPPARRSACSTGRQIHEILVYL